MNPSCWNRDQGYRVQGSKNPPAETAKRVLGAVGLPADFLAFLLVFEREAIEAFTNFKRHGDLVDLVALCPISEVVGLLD